jgi:Arsenical resistance operon trans-acting repressor ArsD.
MQQTKLQVYDPPMCCSSVVCGPKVDPDLVRFSSDLDWLRKKGVVVERFNLSSHTAEFAREERVAEALNREGNKCLPLILVDGVIVSRGSYPLRGELLQFIGMTRW